MKLIVDANVLFKALIKKGITTDLLFEDSFSFYTADFIVEEFLKYEKYIKKKTKLTPEELVETLHMLRSRITVISMKEYSEFIEKAKEISPDKNDALYFAVALKLRCGIWTNDKKLKEQDCVKVFNTKEIIELVY